MFYGFILLSKFCAAQDIKNEYPKYEWAEGIIQINNIQLKGLIQYDEFNRIIRYQSIDENETKSFREKDVIWIEIFDKENGKVIKFYSLPYQYEDLQKEEFFLFEVIYEFSTFAILSRLSNTTATYVTVDPRGNLMPREKTFNQKDIFFFNETRLVELTPNESSNKNLFESSIEPASFNRVLEYMKEKKLKFRSKEDILKAMAFYESLEED
jgi:hypothetical protein